MRAKRYKTAAIMSILYDPVTREFKARESRGPKPQLPPGAPEPPEVSLPPKLPSEVGRQRQQRRYVNARRRHRNRELVTWLLFVVLAGAAIWGSVWLWNRWNRGGMKALKNPSPFRITPIQQE
jgi:hypothetical protein